MIDKLINLEATIKELLSDRILDSTIKFNQLTVVLSSKGFLDGIRTLHNHPSLHFEQCVDICGVDYLDYHNDYVGPRFATVYHLLSYRHNIRLRVRVFMDDDTDPCIDSVCDIYSGANWFEREIFDMYGINFVGHPDLRRILTDYGFEGHPFRKDFPLSGHVEVIYDEDKKDVVYQNVSIQPREITPRVIREDDYGHRNH